VDVHNDGALRHELLIVLTQMSVDELPLEGELVDVTRIDGHLVTEFEELLPKSHVMVTVTVEPGPHVLFCNIVGHYSAGMRGVLAGDG